MKQPILLFVITICMSSINGFSQCLPDSECSPIIFEDDPINYGTICTFRPEGENPLIEESNLTKYCAEMNEDMLAEAPEGSSLGERWLLFWVFGDGDFSFNRAPIHNFIKSGNYKRFLDATPTYDDDIEPVIWKGQENYIQSTANPFVNPRPRFPIEEEEMVPVLLQSSRDPKPGEEFYFIVSFTNPLTVDVNGSIKIKINSDLLKPVPSKSLLFNEVEYISTQVDYSDAYYNKEYTFNTGQVVPGQVKNMFLRFRVPDFDHSLNAKMIKIRADMYDDLNNREMGTQVWKKLPVESHDPNSKTVKRRIVPSSELEDGSVTLHYQIRFQNLGTANAQNVLIEDEIDSLLDFNTIQILGTSLDNTITALNIDTMGRTIYWTLQDAELPGLAEPLQSLNPEETIGYLWYKIKIRDDLDTEIDCQYITNTAEIFFYNDLVDVGNGLATNTTQTLIASEQCAAIADYHPSARLSDQMGMNLTITPNPAIDYIMVLAELEEDEKWKETHVFDLQGRMIYESVYQGEGNSQPIPVSTLNKGLYIVQITTDNGFHCAKFLKN